MVSQRSKRGHASLGLTYESPSPPQLQLAVVVPATSPSPASKRPFRDLEVLIPRHASSTSLRTHPRTTATRRCDGSSSAANNCSCRVPIYVLLEAAATTNGSAGFPAKRTISRRSVTLGGRPVNDPSYAEYVWWRDCSLCELLTSLFRTVLSCIIPAWKK
jgi:hypothetical protein